MQIKVTFTDGTTNLYPVSTNSVITVKEPAPNDSTPGAELSFAFQGATAVELVPDPEPQPVDEHVAVIVASDVSDPETAVPAEESPLIETTPSPSVEFQGNTITATGPNTVSITPSTPAPEQPEASVEPTPDETVDVESAASELPADPDGTVQDTPPDPVFDTAVTSANDAIVAVALGTSDPGSLAKALADVEAALETYPDSSELADAKTQLTELSADNTPPAAA